MDVKELLESKNITYISKGRDYAVRCFNPGHQDSNPSMNIDKISGIFHCLSCGYAGDIFKRYGINKENFINLKLQQVKEEVQSLLSNKPKPMPLDAIYIDKDFRGISKSTLRKFSAFTSDTLMEGRIIFPISNINRDIIGFQGRYMYSDLDPKYKFWPEHLTLPLYPSVVKSINNSIILVEGIFDMINLHDKGLDNAVCTFGTSFGSVKKKDKKQANLDKLLQYKYQGIETVYILYDGDYAGKSAAEKLMENIKHSFNTEIIELEENQDPGGLTILDVKKLKGKIYG